jgi:hypothetical protein
MDQDNHVQDEAPKLRTGVSEPISSPEVGQEPAIFEVRSDAGSQAADAESEERTERKEPQGPEGKEGPERPTQTTLADSESRPEQGKVEQPSESPESTGEIPDGSGHPGLRPVVLSAKARGKTHAKKDGGSVAMSTSCSPGGR